MHLFLLSLSLLLAATTQPTDPLAAEPPVLDVPLASVTPAVGADPADPAWTAAARIAELTPSVNRDKVVAQLQPTQVLLLWDDGHLYVRFICHDTRIHSDFTKRDEPLYKADVVEVFLDVVGDGRQYFELQVSPGNVVFDQNITVTAEPKHQADGVLEWAIVGRDLWLDLGYTMKGLRTATSRVTLEGGAPGWIVDLAIPAKFALRRVGTDRFTAGQQLRANLLRYDYPAEELHAGNWSPVRHGCPHISPARMGRLRLLPAAAKAE
jgi:hypothetical protein